MVPISLPCVALRCLALPCVALGCVELSYIKLRCSHSTEICFDIFVTMTAQRKYPAISAPHSQIIFFTFSRGLLEAGSLGSYWQASGGLLLASDFGVHQDTGGLRGATARLLGTYWAPHKILCGANILALHKIPGGTN